MKQWILLALLAGSVAAVAQTPTPVTTSSGLRYTVLQPGSGRKARRDDKVVVHYTGWITPDGTTLGDKVDSNEGDDDPLVFELGEHKVIRGWDEGVLGMQAGEKRRLVVPAALGYGDRGVPGTIPPNSMLIFEIELLKFK